MIDSDNGGAEELEVPAGCGADLSGGSRDERHPPDQRIGQP